MKKLNLTYWQAVSIRGQGSYAVSLQSDSYCVIPLQGTEPESQRLQNLINASFAL